MRLQTGGVRIASKLACRLGLIRVGRLVPPFYLKSVHVRGRGMRVVGRTKAALGARNQGRALHGRTVWPQQWEEKVAAGCVRCQQGAGGAAGAAEEVIVRHQPSAE